MTVTLDPNLAYKIVNLSKMQCPEKVDREKQFDREKQVVSTTVLHAASRFDCL